MKKFFIIITILFIITGCDNNKKTEKNNSSIYEVRSYLKKDNNWIYYMNITYDNNGVIKYYNFNGINTKTEKIEELYMPVTENGVEIQRLEPICNCLNYYQKYKKEFNEINNYFNNQKFQKKISLNDLDKLNTSYYSKLDLLYLFNKALEIDYKRSKGPFKYTLNSITQPDKDGEWTLVSDGSYGYIEILYIDYKYSNGQYLSELVNKDQVYKRKYRDIKIIEKYILENQSIENISNNIKNINTSDYTKLFDLISRIDDE